MPTFIPQSVSQAVGNVPAPAKDPVIRMYDKEPLPPPQQLRPQLRPQLPTGQMIQDQHYLLPSPKQIQGRLDDLNPGMARVNKSI
jgi:hypothetical protein